MQQFHLRFHRPNTQDSFLYTLLVHAVMFIFFIAGVSKEDNRLANNPILQSFSPISAVELYSQQNEMSSLNRIELSTQHI